MWFWVVVLWYLLLLLQFFLKYWSCLLNKHFIQSSFSKDSPNKNDLSHYMLNNEVHLYNQKQNDHIQDNDYNELHQDNLLENDYSYIIFSNKIPRFTTTITNQTTWTFTLLMTNLMTIMTIWLNKGEIYYTKLYDLYIRRFKNEITRVVLILISWRHIIFIPTILPSLQ